MTGHCCYQEENEYIPDTMQIIYIHTNKLPKHTNISMSKYLNIGYYKYLKKY